MGLDFKRLEASLCNQLCQNIVFHRRDDGVTMLESPLAFPDGDQYPIYVEECANGKVVLSDRGHTLQHISYDHDINSLYDGARSARREQIAKEYGIVDDDGVFSIESDPKDLVRSLFRFGQGLSQIYELAIVAQENKS